MRGLCRGGVCVGGRGGAVLGKETGAGSAGARGGTRDRVRARHVWGDSGVRNENGDGSDDEDDAGDLNRAGSILERDRG